MRTTQEISQQEVQAYREFAEANNMPTDDSQDAIHNANFVHDYFVNTWKETITPSTLAQCFENIRPSLRFLQPYQKEFSGIWAGMSEPEREAFKKWKVRGLKDNMKNAVAVLGYIRAHSWPVDASHLQLALHQSVVSHHLDWEYESTHKETQHSKTDDGTGFLGDATVNEPLWRRKQRED